MPRRTFKAKLSAIAVVIVLFIAYYLFLFDIFVIVKDSIVDYLVDSGFTEVTIPLRRYDPRWGWVEIPYQLDLGGLVDLTLTLAIVLAPFVFAFKLLLD